MLLHGPLHFETDFASPLVAVGMAQRIEAGHRFVARILGNRLMLFARRDRLGDPQRTGTAKHHNVEKRVSTKPVRAVDRHTGRFPGGHQTWHDGVGVILGRAQHFAFKVRPARHPCCSGRSAVPGSPLW